MFVYFDANGVLQEIVNGIPFRQSNADINHIYIYMETDFDGVHYDDNGVALLPTAFNEGLQSYRLANGTVTNEGDFDITPVVGVIPENKKRDLKFFKYHTQYQFWDIKLPRGVDEHGVPTVLPNVLEYDGLCTLNVRLRVEADNSIFSLGIITFTVENSAIKTETDITLSQYNYLLQVIGGEIVYDGYTKSEVDALLADKQDALTEGTGIDIDNETAVISVDTTTIATKTDISDLASENYVDTAVSSKQDALVSGTNIKTVNGVDVLGAGNIETYPNWWYTTSALSYTIDTGAVNINRSNISLMGASNRKIDGLEVAPKVGDYVFYYSGIIGVVLSVTSTQINVVTKWIASPSWTCLEEGTLITLSDGTKKPIEEIQKGDLLLGYDFENSQTCECVCMQALPTVREDKRDILIFSNGKAISCSEHHEIFSKNKMCYVSTREVREGETCIDASGNDITLLAIHRDIFNLGFKQFYMIITSNNTYFANDVLNAMHPVNKYNWCVNDGLDAEILSVIKEDCKEFNSLSFLQNEDAIEELTPVLNSIKLKENQIADAKKFLQETDYVAIKKSEGCTDVDTSVIVERQAKRDLINQCESDIALLNEQSDELFARYSSIGADILLPLEARQSKYFLGACKNDNNNLQLFIDKYCTKGEE